MNSSIFHVGDLNCPLPRDGIVVDTSYIYEAYSCMTSGQMKYDCLNFVNRLAANSIPVILFSCALTELRHVIARAMSREMCRQLGRDLGQWQTLYESNDQLREQIYGEQDRIENTILAPDSAFELIDEAETEDVLRLSKHLSRKFVLQSVDSLIIALGAELGLNSFLTMDKHFARVQDCNIYTANTDLVYGSNQHGKAYIPAEMFEKHVQEIRGKDHK